VETAERVETEKRVETEERDQIEEREEKAERVKRSDTTIVKFSMVVRSTAKSMKILTKVQLNF